MDVLPLLSIPHTDIDQVKEGRSIEGHSARTELVNSDGSIVSILFSSSSYHCSILGKYNHNHNHDHDHDPARAKRGKTGKCLLLHNSGIGSTGDSVARLLPQFMGCRLSGAFTCMRDSLASDRSRIRAGHKFSSPPGWPLASVHNVL